MFVKHSGGGEKQTNKQTNKQTVSGATSMSRDRSDLGTVRGRKQICAIH